MKAKKLQAMKDRIETNKLTPKKEEVKPTKVSPLSKKSPVASLFSKN